MDSNEPGSNNQPGRDPMLVAGVLVIATILLLTFWLIVVLALLNVVDPPTFEFASLIVSIEYFELRKVVVAAIASCALTSISWLIVRYIVRD